MAKVLKSETCDHWKSWEDNCYYPSEHILTKINKEGKTVAKTFCTKYAVKGILLHAAGKGGQ